MTTARRIFRDGLLPFHLTDEVDAKNPSERVLPTQITNIHPKDNNYYV